MSERERVVERKFSGYSLNIPEGLRLFVRLRSGERHELEDLYYFMRLKARDVLSDFEKI